MGISCFRTFLASQLKSILITTSPPIFFPISSNEFQIKYNLRNVPVWGVRSDFRTPIAFTTARRRHVKKS